MKVTTMAKSILFAGALMIGLQVSAPKAEAANICKIQVDCDGLWSAYNKLTEKYGDSSKLAKLAKAYLDKVCPIAPPQETLYECSVFDPSFVNVISVEVTPSNTFDNLSSPLNKVACMSQNACSNIVYTKFFGNGPTVSTRCNDGSTSVVRLTDAEVQSIANATP